MSEIIITPSAAQYEELVGHLETLRTRGATSNTAAILDAVRQAAYDASTHQTAGQRANAPGPEPRR